jgi:pyruvate-formate lyase
MIRLRTSGKLSERTRALAERGLGGELGRQMFPADPGLAKGLPAGGVSEEMKCALAIRLIAETAPLRILPEELIVGSATYLEAVFHRVPILGSRSTSHLTVGFDRALRMGYRGMRRQIVERLARGDLDDRGADLLQSMLVCLDAAGIWHRRHLEELGRLAEDASGSQREHYRGVIDNLSPVPEDPPRTFREAVQSLWFMYAFQRLCGNWSGMGRVDEMLGGYLRRDLAGGVVTLDKAREILAHFWAKGTEWIGARDYTGEVSSGDAQHYQNIVLAGIDADGNEVTNEVTYMVLDIVEELHISDFPVAVRVSERTPRELLRRVAEVQRTGGGIVSIYNENVVIEGLVELGIPPREARCFANDGCWEVLVPGKTAFAYRPFDMMELLQRAIGLDGAAGARVEYESFEGLYAAFRRELAGHLGKLRDETDGAWIAGKPDPLISLFIEDCVEKGRGYHDRGARYYFLAPHAGGLADAANSLLVIKDIVYDRRRMSLSGLAGMLRRNWEGEEALRAGIRERFRFYGNDDDAADAMVVRLFDDYTRMVGETKKRNGVFRPAGVSTFGREIEWRKHRSATAHGFREGEYLATNFCPTPGTDLEGPTAAIKSYCKMDFTRLPNGGTLDISLHPTSVKGEEGLSALVALLEVFVKLGGWYLSVDVVNAEMLRDAQRHPDRYPNLAVRIAGWCARFHTLSRDWQDMIIRRAES